MTRTEGIDDGCPTSEAAPSAPSSASQDGGGQSTPAPGSQSRTREWGHFLFEFLRHPIRTGAIAPSSRFLAARMVEEMGIPAASTVVELGPGTGSFTIAIEREIGPNASFFAVELNPALANGLRSRVKRAVVIEGSAEHLHAHLGEHGCAQADAILCGLPWASFHPGLQERLMTSIEASLRPGGRFATFQYIHASWFPTARRFRKLLERHFSSVETSNVEWRNVPPAFVFRCTK